MTDMPRTTWETETLIKELEGMRLDESDKHINYQIEPYNAAIDAMIEKVRKG